MREDEPFCSRWAANKKGVMMRKTVTSQDLSKAVKEAAEAFGISAENFSAKSPRSGFASQMSACGVERERFLHGEVRGWGGYISRPGPGRGGAWQMKARYGL